GLHRAMASVVGAPVYVENVDCWVVKSRNNVWRALAPNAADAFVVPPPGAFGNVGRNTLRGPSTNLFDFALHRSFPLGEQRSLTFRWEVFNLTNTTQFGLPERDLSNSAFGTITTLSGDPRIMQFALRLRF
ncbi:MAG: TonB-dependent receptor, partial [Bryobacteraceae bacterium]